MSSVVRFRSDWIERVRAASHLPESFWREYLGRSSHLGGGASTDDAEVVLSEARCADLADALGLDPEALVHETVDLRAFEAHCSGEVHFIPEKYRVGAFSRIRTSAHLFDSAEKQFGWKGRRHLLRRFQISESTLGDLTDRISLQFLVDVCAELAFMGVDDQGFRRMGAVSVLRNYHSPAGDQFRDTRSLRELMERGFSETIRTYFEQNYDYRLIYLTSSMAIVDSYGREEVFEALKTKRIGSRLTCQCKVGTFASVPAYKQLPFARVTEIKCVHLGDPCCRYLIDFSVGHEVEKAKTGLRSGRRLDYSNKSEKIL